MNRTRWALVILFLVSIWATLPHAQVTRHVYLTPVDGSGTDADPYHARCYGMAGSGNIDLRDWGINKFLCASDDLPSNMAGVIQLGAARNAVMTGPAKAAFADAAGKAITASTVDGAIVELLKDKLIAGRDGKVKIWLGEAEPLYQQTAWVPFPDHGYAADLWNAIQPTMAWAVMLATETFPTNGDLNGSTQVHGWTEFNGTAWSVSSNQVGVSAAGTSDEARADVALNSTDVAIQATLVAISGTGTGASRCGVIGRKENNATRTFYMFNGDAAPGGTQNFHSSKLVAGVRTSIASTNQTINANDVIRLEVSGTSISGYVNNTLTVGPTTDASISAGTYGGIANSVSASTTSCTIDNWIGYDLSSAGVFRRRMS